MNARETITYLYSHNHIPSHQHLVTIRTEIEKLQAENENLKEAMRKCIKTMEDSNCLELDIIFFLKQALKGDK